MNMRIAYITTYFPLLTQTFVYREVLQLKKNGISVRCFSVKRPKTVVGEVADLQKETTYLWPLNPILFSKAHFYFLKKNPKAYFNTFDFQWRSGKGKAQGRRRYLIHFLEGVYFAYLCVTREVEHIHAHFAHGPASVALVANQLTKIPFSFTAHANDIFVNTWLLAEKIRAAKFVVTISQFNKKHLAALVNRTEDQKIVVVPCGVSLDEFKPGGKASPKVKNILAVGRLVEKKGFKYLLHACKLLKDWGLSFNCTIIGNGEQRELLFRLTEELDVQDKVCFTGALGPEEVRQHLKRSDVFVLPAVMGRDGDRDGIPVSLMEAMAAGVPCISTYVSGIPELISHGRNGRLVPPEDIFDLACALKELLLNDTLRTRLGQEARNTVEQGFNLEINVRKLARLFLEKNAGNIQTNLVKSRLFKNEPFATEYHHSAGACPKSLIFTSF
jgi:glycosyltransferase involved in cell wall biosynthesis